MTCPHATRVNEHAIRCALDLFGGLPSPGVCRTCEHYKGDDANPIPAPLPGPLDMLKSFAVASSRWADAGFPVVSEEEHAERVEICNSCPEWEAGARFGAGKCRVCGCTKLKRWLATERCPKEKWGS